MGRISELAVVLAAVTLAAVAVDSAPARADTPAEPGSRASPYAPQPKQKRNVYGAPIQPPIVGHRKAARSQPTGKHPKKPTAPQSAAKGGKRSTQRSQ